MKVEFTERDYDALYEAWFAYYSAKNSEWVNEALSNMLDRMMNEMEKENV